MFRYPLSLTYVYSLIRITALLLFGSFLLLSSCEDETRRRTDFAVHGIDVSHYQERIDWPAVAAEDISFAFIKATEGVTVADSLFVSNWQLLEQTPIVRGAYHFFHPEIDIHDQAHHFFSRVDLLPGDLPPVLDVELDGGLSKVELIVAIKTWLFLAEAHYGVKPILYSGQTFYNRNLAGHFDAYPLWIARYSRRAPTTADTQQWDFWQYGNQGSLLGIDGDVDFNVFRGTPAQLDELRISAQPSQQVVLR